MKWTNEKPTEPGHYWIKCAALFSDPGIIDIRFLRYRSTHQNDNELIEYWNARKGCWEGIVSLGLITWAGPIPEPEDD